MKYESMIRCLTFVDSANKFAWVNNQVFNKETGLRGPRSAVLQQAMDDDLIFIDPLGRLFLTDKGRAKLHPVKVRRLTFTVPSNMVDAVNSAVRHVLAMQA